MELFKLGFLSIRLLDIFDILIVSIIIFEIWEVFKRNLSNGLVKILIGLFILWKVVDWLDLILLRSILDQFVGIGLLMFIVLFAPEIRRFLTAFGNRSLVSALRNIESRNKTELDYHSLVEAIFEMSKEKTGAIIIVKGVNELRQVERTGEILQAIVSKRLILSLFQKNSPLHDGAVLIKDNIVTACRCVLPVSDNQNLPIELGMRHRSAVGITEVSDALVIVVSEETGRISIIHLSKIYRDLTDHELLEALQSFNNQGKIPVDTFKKKELDKLEGRTPKI